MKKFPSDKINGTKNALFFCELQLITVLSLICNSYMRWNTCFVSLKNMCVSFHFGICFFFIKVCCSSTKFMDSLTLKRHNSFQNQNNRKATHSFAPSALIFKLQLEVWKFNHICVSWSTPKSDPVANFLNPENRSFENVSIVTFK